MTSPAGNNLTVVAGRRVKVARGTKSQTINVCTPANKLGLYDTKYVLAPDVEILPAELAALKDLPALDRWALEHDGHRVHPGHPAPRPPHVPAPDADNDW